MRVNQLERYLENALNNLSSKMPKGSYAQRGKIYKVRRKDGSYGFAFSEGEAKIKAMQKEAKTNDIV